MTAGKLANEAVELVLFKAWDDCEFSVNQIYAWRSHGELFKTGARFTSGLNSFIAVKSGYPLAIDDGIKISLPEIITYKQTRTHAYIGSSIIQLQDGWVTFGGPTIFFYKTGGEEEIIRS